MLNTAVRTIEIVQYVRFSHEHKVYITKNIQLHLVLEFRCYSFSSINLLPYFCLGGVIVMFV